jgi:O-antigen ligase
MRVKPLAPPIKRVRLRTIWVGGTIDTPEVAAHASATALFLAAMMATLLIGFREPRVEYAYECVVFALAAGWCRNVVDQFPPAIPSVALIAIAVWGFLQLTFGATVYRFQTLEASLRFAALAATALVSFGSFRSPVLRVKCLSAIAWLGALVAVVSVLAYFTSRGKILWIFDAPYPDIWGPFLSRNNFAQFLELAMPIALRFALREKARNLLYLSSAAIMLASGLASASRAGCTIMVVEALAVLWLCRKSSSVRQMSLALVFSTILLASVPGTANLIGRLVAPDPFESRREIAGSTLKMISSRPWTGFGLGTFPTVYPEYAVFDVGRSVEHAHNDWLEWAAEGGIPFLLVWVCLALWLVRPAVRTGWGIGVLGCFLHGLVDYPFARFGISAWVLILIGMLAATEVREVRRSIH